MPQWPSSAPGCAGLLCAVVMGVGTALASPPILWTLAVIALVGAVLPFHPFDLIYNYGLRFVTGTRAFPPHGAQRRFACGMAAVWLVGTGVAFDSGWHLAPDVLLIGS